jgi:hypothetical protein
MRALGLKETDAKSMEFIRWLFYKSSNDEMAIENAPAWHLTNYPLYLRY